MIVLDFHQGLPAEPGRILDDPNLRARSAVEHDVEPEILLKPFSRLEFIGRKGDFTDAGPALNLNESDLDCGFRIFRVGPPRNQIESPVFRFHTGDSQPRDSS